MDALGLGFVLFAALCARLLACAGVLLLFTVGLAGTIVTWRVRNTPTQRGKLWASLALLIVGGLGLILMVGGSIINDYAAQQSPTCLELPIGVDYKIAFSPSYNEAVLKQANGQPVDLPAIYSYALTDHYLIGRTAESQGGYFWFDLETQTAKRFAYDQRSEFIQSVKDLGFAEAPLSLTIEEQCRASQCQPCPYGAK